MPNNEFKEFTYAAKEYLNSRSIGDLRIYGREIGLDNPTKMKKGELIDGIVAIFTGVLAPVPKSNKGAPIKNVKVDEEIVEKMAQLRVRYIAGNTPSTFNFALERQRVRELNDWGLRLEDPDAEQVKQKLAEATEIHCGQLQNLNEVFYLLPLNGEDSDRKLLFSTALKEQYGLREGDVITCHAQRGNAAYMAVDVLTVNNRVVNTFKRTVFEQEEICAPTEKIALCGTTGENSAVAKYLDYVLPLGKGQRACVVGAPKTGKTKFLLDIALAVKKNTQNLTLLVLLIDQAPEAVARFRSIIPKENLLYTTYEDDPDRQVFIADFLMKRAKSLTEMGEDVLLLVDSLNSLARAYNDTDASSGGNNLTFGLESKTLQYVKKYFGSARCFEKGSLTMLASVSEQTGNPADELLRVGLTAIASAEYRLSKELAQKRIYPSIDFVESNLQQRELLQTDLERDLEERICSSVISKHGEESAVRALEQAKDFSYFQKLIEDLS